MIKKTCLECKKEFRAKVNKQKFCSPFCYHKFYIKWGNKKCLYCKKDFKGKEKKRFFCCRKCMDLYLVNEKSPSWKGGKSKAHGYVGINKTGKYEHIEIMEKHLGRKLNKKEIVHHTNKNGTDNRIENLVLCKNQEEHIRLEKGWIKVDERWFKHCPGCGKYLEVNTDNFWQRSTLRWISRCKNCLKKQYRRRNDTKKTESRNKKD